MLTLYRSNRAEVLAQLLAAQLLHAPPGPLEPVQVVVNTWPTSRWLGEALALHLGGIAAHLRFPFPGTHLRRVVQLMQADGLGSEREAQADPWRAIHLVWPVLEELPDIAAEPEGELLRLWLLSGPKHGTIDLPTWQLARGIADAFDDYALYRPDLLGQWQAGADLGEGGQPLPPQQLWQPRLYRRLRQRLGVEPFGLKVVDVIHRLRAGEGKASRLTQHLGRRLRLFGPSSMAPIQVQLLQALATRLPVDLFLLTPCPGLWQRCVARRQALSEALALQLPLEGEWMREAPPLEARFGRLGAELQQLLEGTGEAQLSEERQEDLFVRPTRTARRPKGRGASPPQSPSLLHQLQEQLLDQELQPTLHRSPDDQSLEFHACPGPLRQVQIVRDRVLQLLAADPSLEPRHILVMTPSVDTFAPLVATVFGDRDGTGVDLPWRLTDRSQQQEGGVGNALLEMLSLAGDRLTASGLERLLGCGPLLDHFGLSPEAAGTLTSLLQRCGFRWGLGAADRQGDPTHSLSWAIDRLLLGLVLPAPDGTWQTSTAPAPAPASLDTGGRALHLLLRLRHWLEALAQPGPCHVWVERLSALLGDLFGSEAGSGSEVATLHSSLEEWRVTAGGTALVLAPAVVAALLKERLTLESGRFGHRSGALTISALEPMRAIPHRVLILMGLDAGVFPRQGERPGFHLMETSRRLGDPSPADQDRYALLEALLSARDHLLITWNCRDERTGTERPPAAPVQQWLQWLESRLPAEEAKALQLGHEPNPLAASNFLPQGARPPASCDRRLLSAARHLAAGIAPPAQGLANGPGPDRDGDTSTTDHPFEELRAWLMAPQTHWLHGLGLFPGEQRDQVEDLEALELEEWDRAALLRESLALEAVEVPGAVRLDPASAWLSRHRGEGRFPPAQGGALEAARLQERWLSLQAALGSLGEPCTTALQWGAWAGALNLRGDAVVLVHAARERVAQRLELWLQLQLAVAAMESAPPRRGVLIARGSEKKKDHFAIQCTFTAPDPEEARRELARLWQLRQSWLTACWPVPPETGWAWVEQGEPAVGTKSFEKVARVWSGDSYLGSGERHKEDMQLCFGHQRTLEALRRDLPFERCAQTLFGPILAAVVPAKAARR